MSDSLPRFFQQLAELSEILGSPGDELELNLSEKEYRLEEHSFCIRTPLHVKSSCKTTIVCRSIVVLSNDVTISDLQIVGAIAIFHVSNVSISNCTFIRGDSGTGGALVLTEARSVHIDNVHCTDLVHAPGIFAESNSVFELTNSSVSRTGKHACVNISAGTHAKIAHCKFSESGEHGVSAMHQSRCDLEDCEFSQIARSAVYGFDGLVNCTRLNVRDVKETAISVLYCPESIFRDNEFRRTKSSCVSISSAGKEVFIENNVFEDIEGNAVSISDDSIVVARNNRITRGSYPAFAILQRSEATLERNHITHLEKAGICVRNARRAILTDNVISECGDCGVSISDTDECVLNGNTISNCAVAGIESYNQSKTTATGNTFIRTGSHAFMAFTGGTIMALGNKVRGVATSLLHLSTFGGGHLIDNVEVADCPAQVMGLTSATYFLRGNGDFPGATNDPQLEAEQVKFIPTPENAAATNCLQCGVRPKALFCAPCGHKVFCTQCGRTGDEDLSCPLCRFQVTNVTEGFRNQDDDTCQLCATKPANGIVLPCGHITACFECLITWFRTKSTCPTCNMDKVTFKKVLPDY
jgi:parallel beta-helix repeat protein